MKRIIVFLLGLMLLSSCENILDEMVDGMFKPDVKITEVSEVYYNNNQPSVKVKIKNCGNSRADYVHVYASLYGHGKELDSKSESFFNLKSGQSKAIVFNFKLIRQWEYEFSTTVLTVKTSVSFGEYKEEEEEDDWDDDDDDPWWW